MTLLFDRYVSDEMIEIVRKKSPHLDRETLISRVEEFVRFALLAEKMEGIFLPCSQEIDDIWHLFILETREYFSFCNKIRPGYYLHHHGISYEDHRRSKTKTELLEEDLSVLATYVVNFGRFQSDNVGYWPVAQYIASIDEMGVAGLNSFLERLSKNSSTGGEE